MDELVHIIEPVLHPSNRSNLQLLSGRFAMNLVEAFCSRREKEMSEDSMIPEHARYPIKIHSFFLVQSQFFM